MLQHIRNPVSRHHHLTCLLLSTALLGAAFAEPAATSNKPDPLNPKAAVPAVVYVSSIKASDTATTTTNAPAPMAWREANDKVARLGGWRAYAREAEGRSLP